jgi:hypothetical protein
MILVRRENGVRPRRQGDGFSIKNATCGIANEVTELTVASAARERSTSAVQKPTAGGAGRNR